MSGRGYGPLTALRGDANGACEMVAVQDPAAKPCTGTFQRCNSFSAHVGRAYTRLQPFTSSANEASRTTRLVPAPLERAARRRALDDTVADCNERFCRILGCDATALVGKTFLELCPEVQADGAFSASAGSAAGTPRGPASRSGFRGSSATAGRRVHALVQPEWIRRPGRVVAQCTTSRTSADAGWTTRNPRAAAAGARSHQGGDLRQGPRRALRLRQSRARARGAHARRAHRRPHRPRDLAGGDRRALRANDAQVLASARAIEFEVTARSAASARLFCRSSSRSSRPTASLTRCAASRPTSPSASARRMR